MFKEDVEDVGCGRGVNWCWWSVGWRDLQAMKPDAPVGGLVKLREGGFMGRELTSKEDSGHFWRLRGGGGVWGRCIVNDGYDAIQVGIELSSAGFPSDLYRGPIRPSYR